MHMVHIETHSETSIPSPWKVDKGRRDHLTMYLHTIGRLTMFCIHMAPVKTCIFHNNFLYLETDE